MDAAAVQFAPAETVTFLHLATGDVFDGNSFCLKLFSQGTVQFGVSKVGIAPYASAG